MLANGECEFSNETLTTFDNNEAVTPPAKRKPTNYNANSKKTHQLQQKFSENLPTTTLILRKPTNYNTNFQKTKKRRHWNNYRQKLPENVFMEEIDIQSTSFERFEAKALNIEQIRAEPTQVYKKVPYLINNSPQK